MYKLFAHLKCPYAQRVLIGKQIRKISDDVLLVEWVDFMNPPSELLAINPDWSVPTISYATNKGFSDSAQILEFLDTIEASGPKIFGNNSHEIAETRFLVWQLQNKIIQPLKECMAHLHNSTKLSFFAKKLQLGFEFIESQLPAVGFFGGDSLKAPDIILASFLGQLKALHVLNMNVPLPAIKSRTYIYLNQLLENTQVAKICPKQEDLVVHLAKMLAINPKLGEIQKATDQILTEDKIEQTIAGFSGSSPWKIKKDSLSLYLKAEIKFGNSTEALRSLNALHAMQETTGYHAKVTLADFSFLEILLRTDKPSPGISIKDTLFAAAIVDFVLSEYKYGEVESSVFN